MISLTRSLHVNCQADEDLICFICGVVKGIALLRVPAVCGGELEMDKGHLESPNFPEDYPALKECVWRITVPESFQVALKFQSFEVSFKKMSHYLELNCCCVSLLCQS